MANFNYVGGYDSQTGQPREGKIEAKDEDAALVALLEQGILGATFGESKPAPTNSVERAAALVMVQHYIVHRIAQGGENEPIEGPAAIAQKLLAGGPVEITPEYFEAILTVTSPKQIQDDGERMLFFTGEPDEPPMVYVKFNKLDRGLRSNEPMAFGAKLFPTEVERLGRLFVS